MNYKRFRFKKSIIVGTLITGIALGLSFVSTSNIQAASKGTYVFTPAFIPGKTTIDTWGSYSNSWKDTNKVFESDMSVLNYDSGGSALTLNTRGGTTTRTPNGSYGVIYKDVGISPKDGKQVDMKVTVQKGTLSSYAKYFQYNKISFAKNKIAFSTTGYRRLYLTVKFIHHDTGKALEPAMVGWEMNDFDNYQTVGFTKSRFSQIAQGGIKKADYVRFNKSKINDYFIQDREITDGSGYSQSQRYVKFNVTLKGGSFGFNFGKQYNRYPNYPHRILNGANTAAAEYLAFTFNQNGIGSIGKPEKTILNSGTTNNKKLYTVDASVGYTKKVSYEIKSGYITGVGSPSYLKTLYLKDSPSSAMTLVSKPKLYVHDNSGNVIDVTNANGVSYKKVGTGFQFKISKQLQFDKAMGGFFTIRYEMHVNISASKKIETKDGYLVFKNNMTQTWDDSIKRNTTYRFKSLGDTKLDKTVSLNGGAYSHALEFTPGRNNVFKYKLVAKIGSTTQDGKTISKLVMSDKMPKIFKKVNASDVSILSDSKDVSSDFKTDISKSGGRITVAVSGKNAAAIRKYAGKTVTIYITSAINSMNSDSGVKNTLTDYTEHTSSDSATQTVNGQKVISIVNTFKYKDGDSTPQQTSSVIYPAPATVYIKAVMKGTHILIRKSNSDTDVVMPNKITVNHYFHSYYGFYEERRSGSELPVKSHVGWVGANNGKDYYNGTITFDTWMVIDRYGYKYDKHGHIKSVYVASYHQEWNHHGRKDDEYEVPFIKNKATVQPVSGLYQSGNSNNEYSMTAKITRNNMWSNYSLKTDQDLKNAYAYVDTVDKNSGKVLAHDKFVISDSDNDDNSNGSGSSEVEATFTGRLSTSGATYKSGIEPGTSSSDTVQYIEPNLHVQDVNSFGSRNVRVYNYRTGGVTTENHPITWENVDVKDGKSGTYSKIWKSANSQFTYDGMKDGATNEVNGQQTVKAIQDSYTDFTNGSGKYLYESGKLKDNALDFSITAGYGFSNSLKMDYTGYESIDDSDKNDADSSATTGSLEGSSDMFQDTNTTPAVGVSTSGNQTTLNNVYELSNSTGMQEGDVDDTTGLQGVNYSKTFHFKKSALTADGGVFYATQSDSKNGGNKVYTAIKSNLDESEDEYHVVNTKLNGGFGINNFGVDYDKHVSIDAPLMLASNSGYDSTAELALQEVFNNSQVANFSDSQNQWVADGSGSDDDDN